jgi:hypothetical protein
MEIVSCLVSTPAVFQIKRAFSWVTYGLQLKINGVYKTFFLSPVSYILT